MTAMGTGHPQLNLNIPSGRGAPAWMRRSGIIIYTRVRVSRNPGT